MLEHRFPVLAVFAKTLDELQVVSLGPPIAAALAALFWLLGLFLWFVDDSGIKSGVTHDLGPDQVFLFVGKRLVKHGGQGGWPFHLGSWLHKTQFLLSN